MKTRISNIDKAISQVKDQMCWAGAVSVRNINAGSDIPLIDDDIVFCDIETKSAIFVTKVGRL